MKYFFQSAVFIFLLLTKGIAYGDSPYYLDFKYILNESTAGKKAQSSLKNKLDKGVKNLRSEETKILEEEKKLIQQKKILAPEEYKKKVTELRAKVSKIQKKRSELLNSVAKQRSKARNELLKNLNPIIEEYVKEKKIRMVVDKKNLIMADENLDITKDIMGILNKKLTTLKLN